MIITDTRPKARKEHRCELCTVAIKPGETYVRKVDATDGLMFTLKECETCDDLIYTVWSYFGMTWDEGVDAEDFWEWAREEQAKDPRALAYLVRRGVVAEEEADA